MNTIRRRFLPLVATVALVEVCAAQRLPPPPPPPPSPADQARAEFEGAYAASGRPRLLVLAEIVPPPPPPPGVDGRTPPEDPAAVQRRRAHASAFQAEMSAWFDATGAQRVNPARAGDRASDALRAADLLDAARAVEAATARAHGSGADVLITVALIEPAGPDADASYQGHCSVVDLRSELELVRFPFTVREARDGDSLRRYGRAAAARAAGDLASAWKSRATSKPGTVRVQISGLEKNELGAVRDALAQLHAGPGGLEWSRDMRGSSNVSRLDIASPSTGGVIAHKVTELIEGATGQRVEVRSVSQAELVLVVTAEPAARANPRIGADPGHNNDPTLEALYARRGKPRLGLEAIQGAAGAIDARLLESAIVRRLGACGLIVVSMPASGDASKKSREQLEALGEGDAARRLGGLAGVDIVLRVTMSEAAEGASGLVLTARGVADGRDVAATSPFVARSSDGDAAHRADRAADHLTRRFLDQFRSYLSRETTTTLQVIGARTPLEASKLADALARRCPCIRRAAVREFEVGIAHVEVGHDCTFESVLGEVEAAKDVLPFAIEAVRANANAITIRLKERRP